MAQITVKTNEKEANAVLSRDKSWLVRSDKGVLKNVKPGDIIKLQLIKNLKPVYHPISKKAYVVTIVDNYITAPIAKGSIIISLKEVV